MFFAIAALLIQPQIAPQLSFPAQKIALISPMNSAAISSSAAASVALPPAAPMIGDAAAADTAVTDASVQPVAASNAVVPPGTPVPASAVNSPVPAALILVKPGKPMTVSVDELLAENRRKRRLWRGLAIASGSAATFDAWSTRHAITTAGAQELNPLLKPFAGNASLYLAIQVGPTLMDYAGKKMMYSRHGWVRHMWWVPQSASFVSSMFCGAHNLGVN